MTPTRRGDHRTLFWVFFIFTPLQYILIGLGSNPPSFLAGSKGMDYYDFYSIMIPVYASLFIPAERRSPATTNGSWNAVPRSNSGC